MSKIKDVRACPEIVVKKIEEASLATEQKLHEPFSRATNLILDNRNDEWGADDSDDDFGPSTDTNTGLLAGANHFNLISDEDVAKKKMQPLKKWGQIKLASSGVCSKSIDSPEEPAEVIPEPEEVKPKKYVPRALKEMAAKKQPTVDFSNTKEFVSLDEIASWSDTVQKQPKTLTRQPKEKKQNKQTKENTFKPILSDKESIFASQSLSRDNTFLMEKFLCNINISTLNVSLDPKKVASKYQNRPKETINAA